MRRLFGLIGLTYLAVLTVVFYLYSLPVVIVTTVLSAVLIVVGVFTVAFNKVLKFNRELIAVGITSLCACFALVCFSNLCYVPLIDNYSEKEVSVDGYVCDDIEENNGYFIYTIKTKKVDNTSESLRFQIVSDAALEIESFDCVSGNVYLRKNEYTPTLSKGIYFSAYPDNYFSLEAIGEKHYSFYAAAVCLRNTMEDALDKQLDYNSASLCKAVLLGNKNALDYEILGDFSQTGSTFLIVVSGMHLSVVAAFVLFAVKKFTNRKRIQSLAVIATVFLFVSITGFSSSTVRASVMTIIAYSGIFFRRRSDPLNSIGIAALVLTAFNPFAVGDIGMLLSFAATLGIILWSGKIDSFIIAKAGIKNKFLKTIISIVSVSISAAIWVMPVTTLAFGRISPYIVILSVFVETAVSGLIIFALLTSLFYLFFMPILSYFCALICAALSKYIIFAVGAFAVIPYSSLKTDKVWFYVWIAVTALLIILGYIIKAKKKYIGFSITFSIFMLMSVYIFYVFAYPDTSTLTLFEMYNGVTISIESENNISFISCGGPSYRKNDVLNEIAENSSTVDYLIVPSQKNKYSAYFYDINSEFDCSDILIYYSKNRSDIKYSGDNIHIFGSGIGFDINLTKTVVDTVICIDGVTYQYICGEEADVLFVPSGGDIAKLSAKYRTADYVIVDDIPENIELLDCNTIIFAATGSNYKEEYSYLADLYNEVLSNRNNSIKIDL